MGCFGPKDGLDTPEGASRKSFSLLRLIRRGQKPSQPSVALDAFSKKQPPAPCCAAQQLFASKPCYDSHTASMAPAATGQAQSSGQDQPCEQQSCATKTYSQANNKSGHRKVCRSKETAAMYDSAEAQYMPTCQQTCLQTCNSCSVDNSDHVAGNRQATTAYSLECVALESALDATEFFQRRMLSSPGVSMAIAPLSSRGAHRKSRACHFDADLPSPRTRDAAILGRPKTPFRCARQPELLALQQQAAEEQKWRDFINSQEFNGRPLLVSSAQLSRWSQPGTDGVALETAVLASPVVEGPDRTPPSSWPGLPTTTAPDLSATWQMDHQMVAEEGGPGQGAQDEDWGQMMSTNTLLKSLRAGGLQPSPCPPPACPAQLGLPLALMAKMPQAAGSSFALMQEAGMPAGRSIHGDWSIFQSLAPFDKDAIVPPSSSSHRTLHWGLASWQEVPEEEVPSIQLPKEATSLDITFERLSVFRRRPPVFSESGGEGNPVMGLSELLSPHAPFMQGRGLMHASQSVPNPRTRIVLNGTEDLDFPAFLSSSSVTYTVEPPLGNGVDAAGMHGPKVNGRPDLFAALEEAGEVGGF